MRVGVIAPMGTSPPVLTEFVEYVQRTERVSRLVILATKERMVVDSAKLADAAIRDRYPHIRVELIELPQTDITSEEDNYAFMEAAAKALSGLRREVERLYLCIAGGRKEIVASMMLIAQLGNVDAAYHVVAPDVKALNVALERIRKEIEDLGGSPSPLDYYRERREVFEPVMYPDPSTYEVIAVPIVPFPPEVTSRLAALLSRQRVARREAGLSEEYLRRLEQAGFISLTKTKVVVTDQGRRLYESVLRHLG
ncbi:MAG: CRISPR-associated ring nuclease [Candidatus Caldarchaeales archaeon]